MLLTGRKTVLILLNFFLLQVRSYSPTLHSTTSLLQTEALIWLFFLNECSIDKHWKLLPCSITLSTVSQRSLPPEALPVHHQNALFTLVLEDSINALDFLNVFAGYELSHDLVVFLIAGQLTPLSETQRQSITHWGSLHMLPQNKMAA